jgi:magnesium chelatase subunit D
MTALPFSAVVGQEDAKTALLLAAIQPRLGGVLLRGHKGSAKTTLARGLASLLPGEAPFVELPLGATEDRVLGSLDLSELLTNANARYRPGLLAAAHGGVLYVDEINLLADHLVDVLLDVAVSGIHRVEREGISHEHPARFTLVASMNPEEGELRPQLLDRFGLAVDIETPVDPEVRRIAVETQLAADADAGSLQPHLDNDAQLRDRIAAAQPAPVPDEVISVASRVAVAVGAEGLRADLMLCRAAGAYAGLHDRALATIEDVQRVAPFVLAHRRRRAPFDEPGIAPDELDDAMARALQPTNDRESEPAPPDAGREAPSLAVKAAPFSMGGRRTQTTGPRGRFERDAPATETTASIAVGPTALALAQRRAIEPDADLAAGDLRAAVRETKTGVLVILVVDTSGSMGADQRIAAAKGVALELLTDAYQHRDRVALIAFRGEDAEVVLRPTGSVEIARARLTALPVGGTTPLAAALDAGRVLGARARRDQQLAPYLVLITDGRATSGGDDPVRAARIAATRVADAGIPALIVDAETGPARLGLAADFARHLGGDCVAIDDLDARGVIARARAVKT